MLLPYGKKLGKFTHISEVPSGRTDLRCPYCGSALLAKKGKQNAHHFAHVGKSCMSTGSAALLDLGRKLPTQLSIVEYAQRKLQRIAQQKVKLQKRSDFLTCQDINNKKHIKTLVDYLRAHQMEQQAKAVIVYIKYEFEAIPSLDTLPTSFSPHLKAVAAYHATKQKLAEANVKLELYAQELEWFHRFQLYFLEIRTGAYSIFYKIGLTARDLSERLKEIKKDLVQFQQVEIRVLHQLSGVAFLETFFKQKYQHKRYQLGQHTEYFVFEHYEIARLSKEFEQIQTRR